jgi:inosose dehydratase
VWFPDEPRQTPWQRFLDEVARAGYEWIELGPYGYLPTDPGQLRDELDRRGLRLSGGAVAAGLHRGPEALKQAVEDCRAEARLLTALGARHLVLLPEGYTELDGSLNQPAELDAEQWQELTTGMDTLADLFPCDFDTPLPIATRTARYLGGCGLGPVRASRT